MIVLSEYKLNVRQVDYDKLARTFIEIHFFLTPPINESHIADAHGAGGSSDFEYKHHQYFCFNQHHHDPESTATNNANNTTPATWNKLTEYFQR